MKLALAVGVAALALALGTAEAGDAAVSDGGPSAQTTTTIDSQLALSAHDAGQAVFDFESAAEPTRFAGVTIDAANRAIDLYLVSPGPNDAEAVQPTAGKFTVRVHAAATSLARLQTEQDRLTQDMIHWQQQGVPITNWGIAIGDNVLRVGMRTPTEDQKQQVLAAYPDAVIEAPTEGSGTADRASDVSPWNGGDFITNGTEDCTSGPAVNNTTSSSVYLLTAAHCFTLNTVVHNRASTLGFGANGTMGTITVRDVTAGQLDVEMVRANNNAEPAASFGPAEHPPATV